MRLQLEVAKPGLTQKKSICSDPWEVVMLSLRVRPRATQFSQRKWDCRYQRRSGRVLFFYWAGILWTKIFSKSWHTPTLSWRCSHNGNLRRHKTSQHAVPRQYSLFFRRL